MNIPVKYIDNTYKSNVVWNIKSSSLIRSYKRIIKVL